MITQETISSLIKAGTLAPSVDNCQPWLFSAKGANISIYLDKPRAEFFGDYQFAASYVTLGAVIENICIAAADRGYGCSVEYPSPVTDQSPVARLSLRESEAADASLFPFLTTRCTSRFKYQRRRLSDTHMARLKETAPTTGASLYLFDDPKTLDRLYKLSSSIDAIIFSHIELHGNLFKWIRWNLREKEQSSDGLPIDCLGLKPPDLLFFRFISSWSRQQLVNMIGINKLIGLLNSRLLLHSSCLGFIVMEGSSKEDYLEGGRYFERVWLTAASQGLSLQPFGGLPFLLTRLLHAGGEGFSKQQYLKLQTIAQAMTEFIPVSTSKALVGFFRIGYGPLVAARTLRRHLGDVVVGSVSG